MIADTLANFNIKFNFGLFNPDWGNLREPKWSHYKESCREF